MKRVTTCGCGARKDHEAATCRRCWREQAEHPAVPSSSWETEDDGQRFTVRAADQADEGRYANG